MNLAPGLPFQFEAPLLTERLVLRLLTAADVDDVYAWQSRADVCRYLLFEPRSRELVTEKVAEYGAASRIAKDNDFLELAVQLRDPADPRVIGISYFCLRSLDNSTGEIGWQLHADYWGRGYAVEAANAMLDLAFGTFKLHRMIAELDARNESSASLCRRLGMREEAHFVQDMMFKGGWSDTGIYALLADEWRAARAAQPQADRDDAR
ncbi:MAG: GNAT family protein [Propionibacteriaceae bacterium]